MAKLALFPMLLAAACVVSGVYGAVHDRLSYTVSPDDFHRLVFHQFRIPVGLHTRAGAALVGWHATWWMGLFIGFPLRPGRVPRHPHRVGRRGRRPGADERGCVTGSDDARDNSEPRANGLGAAPLEMPEAEGDGARYSPHRRPPWLSSSGSTASTVGNGSAASSVRGSARGAGARSTTNAAEQGGALTTSAPPARRRRPRSRGGDRWPTRMPNGPPRLPAGRPGRPCGTSPASGCGAWSN